MANSQFLNNHTYVLDSVTGLSEHNQKVCMGCVPINPNNYILTSISADNALLSSMRYMITKSGGDRNPQLQAVTLPYAVDPIFDAPMFEEQDMLDYLAKKNNEKIIDPGLQAANQEFGRCHTVLMWEIVRRINQSLKKLPNPISASFAPCPGKCNCCWSSQNKIHKIAMMRTTHLISCLLYSNGSGTTLYASGAISTDWFPGNKVRPMVVELRERLIQAYRSIYDEEVKTMVTIEGEDQPSSTEQAALLELFPLLLEL